MGFVNKAAILCDKIAEWSIYILIFTLPFSKSLVEITIVTALIGIILKKVALKEYFSGDFMFINVCLIFYLVFNLLSLCNSQYLSLSIRALFSKSLKFAALFYIVKDIIDTKTKLKNFIIIAFISCVIILIDGFTQYFVTGIDFLHNYPAFNYAGFKPGGIIFPTASFPFQNDFAAWIVMFIFPVGAFAFWAKPNWRSRIVATIVLVCLLYMLILTKVRGAWIGFLIALVFLSIFKLKRIGILLIIGFILSALFVNKTMLPAIFSIANDRSVMLKNGVEIFKKHPIIGNGINTFFVEYREIRNDYEKGKRGSYAHNCYLQMAADVGLLGLISFLLFVAAVLSTGFKALKIIKDPLYYSLILGIGLGLIAFLVHSAGDTNLYSLPLAALFWLSAGILLATVKLVKTNT
jgi:O-antigen ligase